MCGRYGLVARPEKIERRFNVMVVQPELILPRYNIGPGQLAPVITSHQPHLLQFFRFGFTPYWAKKPMNLINARAEGDLNQENSANYTGGNGIFSKPAFRDAIRQKRCIIPADFFYEGPSREKLSKPYLIYLRDELNRPNRPFAFAGVWDSWVNKEAGEEVNSFAIVTIHPNTLMGKIGHHRMPVILRQEDEQRWLNASEGTAFVNACLNAYPDHLMNAYPVSTKVKSPTAEGRELVEPVGERLLPEHDLHITGKSYPSGPGGSKKTAMEIIESLRNDGHTNEEIIHISPALERYL